MRARIATISMALMLGACSTIVPPGPPMMVQGVTGEELIGRSLRLETSGGQASTLQFDPGGVVRAQFGSQEIRGNWVVANDQLCFAWTGAPRECWPYTTPFRPGETMTVTSDRGNVVRVTLQ